MVITLVILIIVVIFGNLIYQNKKHNFSTTFENSTTALAVDVKTKQLRVGFVFPRYCKIEDVVDVDMDVRTKKGHVIRNAAIGSLVAGNVGAWIGITSTKDKIQKIIIRLTLKDGLMLSSSIKEPKKSDLKDLERVVNVISQC